MVAIPTASELTERLDRFVPGYVRRTFTAAFFSGLMIHLFMLANKLPNPDDLGQLIDPMHRPNSGRWFQFFPAAISSNYSMPAVNGVLAILYISIAACFVASLFRIRRAPYNILLGVLMVSFPTVASTLSYMNAADAYAFSLLLACLAAFTADRYKFGFLFAIPMITLSLGIYQAYIAVAAALLVGLLILEILRGQTELKRTIIKGVKFLLVLLLGLLFYMLMVRLTATGLTDYMGISEMGRIGLNDILGLVVSAYRNAFSFFFDNAFLFHLSFMKYVFVIGAVAVVGLVLVLAVRNKVYVSVLKLVLLIVLMLLLPLAANIIYVMAKDQVHLLMVYGLVVLFAFPLALASEASSSTSEKPVIRNLTSLGSLAISLTLLLSTYNYALVSNQAYLKLNMVYEQGYAYSNRLIARIQAVPDYDDDMGILLIGEAALPPGGLTERPLETPASHEGSALKPITGREFADAPQLSKITGLSNGITTSSFNLSIFMRYYLGFNQPIETIEEYGSAVEPLPSAISGMPVYPDDGSIAVVDGQILVKLSKLD